MAGTEGTKKKLFLKRWFVFIMIHEKRKLIMEEKAGDIVRIRAEIIKM